MEKTANTQLTKQEKEQLFRALWNVADVLRGAMTADNFRDYMLSLLFYRYISARYEAAARRELRGDLPEGKSLRAWYAENEADVAEFEDMMLKGTHYIIKPKYLWSAIYELARTQDDNLLTELKDSFRHIEEESFKGAFKGLFSEINLDSEKLGKDRAARNKMMCNVISKLEEKLIEFDGKGDILGDAYEYLIGQFAAGSGKKAGEFYTPQQVSTILSRIVTLDCQDPSTGSKKELASVLDFACGSGSLLLNVNNEMKKAGGKIGKIYGQEKEVTTFNLARMNMLLHGLHDSEFEIFHGDTLTNDWAMLKDSNPVKPVEFDAVVANPPFSADWSAAAKFNNDDRFSKAGVLAPKSKADYAFILHMIYHLNDGGTMACVAPHGVLFRGSAEGKIRQFLIEKRNYIDAIIGLPANIFYGTSIPTCIIVIKKCRKEGDNVLFIDASKEFEKVKTQNKLRPEHIQKIIDTYRERKEIEKYSHLATMQEIIDNDYNLNIPRYVDTFEEEEPIDIHAVMGEIKELEAKRADLDKQIEVYLKELGIVE